MHFTTTTFISALAATAFANPVAIGNPSLTIERRATTTLVCAGDGSGKSIGVEACCQVTFKDRSNIEYDCCVTDTKADGHGVYAWLRTSGDNGYYKDLPTSGVLENHLGKGNTECTHVLPWHQAASKVTGFRVEACVSDAGSDTCTRSAFTSNSYQ